MFKNQNNNIDNFYQTEMLYKMRSKYNLGKIILKMF